MLVHPRSQSRSCLQRPHEPRRIRVSLRIVVAGEGLRNLPGPTDFREHDSGGLTAVIIHEVSLLGSVSVGEPALSRHIQPGQLA